MSDKTTPWPQSLHASAELARQKVGGTAPPMSPPDPPSAVYPMSVYDCIVAVMDDLRKEGVGKTRDNKQQGYKFRGIDEVMNALAPLLAKHRLVIVPRMLSRTMVERESKTGGALFSVTVEAEFDFISAADRSMHTAKNYGEAMDSADKATNKAMAAAYKYAAVQTFCIPTEGDNDADAHTHEPKAKGYSVEAPPRDTKAEPVIPHAQGRREGSVPHQVDAPGTVGLPANTAERELPAGAVLIKRVEVTPTRNKSVSRYLVTLSTGEQISTIKEKLGALCQAVCQERCPVIVETSQSGDYVNLEGVQRADQPF